MYVSKQKRSGVTHKGNSTFSSPSRSFLEMVFESETPSNILGNVVFSEGNCVNWVASPFSSVLSIVCRDEMAVWEGLLKVTMRGKMDCFIFQDASSVLHLYWGLIRGRHWASFFFFAVDFSCDFIFLISLQCFLSYPFYMNCCNRLGPPSLDVVWVNE